MNPILVALCFYAVLSPDNVTGTEKKLLHGRQRRLNRRHEKKVHQGEWPHNVLAFKKVEGTYRAFCAGSIITPVRVLTSANCFLTHKKRNKVPFDEIRFVGGVLKTVVKETNHSEIEQWRTLEHVFSQKFYRFPAFNLAIARINKPWIFNIYVNKIPYASRDYNFNGVCTATAVKATKSWSDVKYVYTEEVEMLERKECEQTLLRSCRLFICSTFDIRTKYVFSEAEGGSLVCYETGDPAEVDINQGVLVGVTSSINVGLPNLHMRVGLFSDWVKNTSCNVAINKIVIVTFIIVCIKTILV